MFVANVCLLSVSVMKCVGVSQGGAEYFLQGLKHLCEMLRIIVLPGIKDDVNSTHDSWSLPSKSIRKHTGIHVAED